MKSITLCADDYGQNFGISHAIRKLVTLGRISAVSCFTETEFWGFDGLMLQQCPKHFDTGLHFSLTGPGQPSLRYWIYKSLQRKVDSSHVRKALISQWESFGNVMGREPDYLDGHQHVHILPGISQVVDRTLTELGAPPGFAIRRVSRSLDDARSGPISFLKSSVLHRLAMRGEPSISDRFSGNSSFGGIYPFIRTGCFPQRMRHWLFTAPASTLIMCHPGFLVHDDRDPIANFRQAEFQYLSSTDFNADLTAAKVRLVPFREVAA